LNMLKIVVLLICLAGAFAQSNTPYQWNLVQNISMQILPLVSSTDMWLITQQIGYTPEVYTLNSDGQWSFSQWLQLNPDLLYSGVGGIDGNSIFQLSSSDEICYALFYQNIGGVWDLLQTIELDQSVLPGPCLSQNLFNVMYADIYDGVAAVVNLTDNGGSGSGGILVIFEMDNSGTWSFTSSFKFPYGIYYALGQTVAVGDNMIALSVSPYVGCQNYVYLYDSKSGEWSMSPNILSHTDVCINTVLNNNQLFLGMMPTNHTINVPYILIYETSDGGYSWNLTNTLQISYTSIPSFGTVLSVSDDGNSIFLGSMANEQNLLFFYHNNGGQWIEADRTFTAGGMLASADNSGDDFLLGCSSTPSAWMGVSYYTQS